VDWQAYKKLRHDQIKKAGYPLLVYHSSDGFYCPDNHLAMDGLVVPADHPFWARWLPAHYQRCACYFSGARTEAQARRLGGNPDKPVPDWWKDVDPSEGSFDL
jgi:uncharacterized protein with gpF-like domain